MAYASIQNAGNYSDIVCKINNLTYQTQNYGQIIFRLYKYYNNTWNLDSSHTGYGYEFYGVNYYQKTFTGREPGYYYALRVWVNYNGTWYLDDPGFGYGYHIGFNDGGSNGEQTDNAFFQMTSIPDATFSNVITQKTTIQFDYTNTVGNLSLFVYDGYNGQWVNIASSGLPYSTQSITNGTRITITNLIPNTSFYFHVKTYVGSYYSWSPGGSYNTYTTQGWPTISGQVSANTAYGAAGRWASQTECGIIWQSNDHGFENFNFGYGLSVNDSSSWYIYTLNDSSGNYSPATTNFGGLNNYKVAPAYQGYWSGNSNAYGWYNSGVYTTNASIRNCPREPATLTLNSTTITSISVNANKPTPGDYIEFRWYQSGNFVGSITLYGGGTSYNITGLSPGTQYEIRAYTIYQSLYSYTYLTFNISTDSLITPGAPTNVSVINPNGSLSVDVYYQWGSNATGMDIRWSTDQSTWTNYDNQQQNLYPSPNYNIGVGSSGNKYFQVRSRRNDSGYLTYSSWVNASPYPISVANRPSNFTWTNTPTSGNTLNLKASDIESLKTKINAFRAYKGISIYTYNFTAVTGNTIYASNFNDLRTALNSLSSYFVGYTLRSSVSINDSIYASDWNNLSNCLNSIT